MARRSRALVFLALLLAVAATAAFWRMSGEGPWSAHGETRGPATDPEGTALSPDVDVQGLTAHRAELAGIGGPREVPHGPVLVRVVDRRGDPVPGVRVLPHDTAPRPPPASLGPVSQPTWEAIPPSDPSRVTDDVGNARFDDLPHDGTVVVEARGVGDAMSERGELTPLPAELFLSDAVASDDAKGIRIVFRGGGEDESTSSEVFFSGSRPLQVHPTGPPPGGVVLARAPVRGAEVTLTIDRGLPFHLEVVVAGDGRPTVEARWEVTPRVEASSGELRGPPHVPAAPGSELRVHPVVESVPGTAPRGSPAWTVRVHPEARRLEARYPLRPEAEVLVVFPAEALPFRPEDWSAEVVAAGIPVPEPRMEWVGAGRLRIRGASHGVSEGITIGGTLAGRWRVSGAAEMPADPREPVILEARLEALGPARAAVLEAASVGSISLVDVEWAFDRLLPGRPAPPPTSPGTLHVLALRPDGRPAVGAIVEAAGQDRTADAMGWARFSEIEAGAHEVRVFGAGAAGMRTANVVAGTRSEVTIQPGSGATLDVEVVDHHGTSIPMATLTVQQASGLPWVDLRDGVQRVDPFTDVRGRRRLEGVEPGRLVLHADYGGRETTVELDVVDGETRPVRLFLPAPFPTVRTIQTTEDQ